MIIQRVYHSSFYFGAWLRNKFKLQSGMPNLVIPFSRACVCFLSIFYCLCLCEKLYLRFLKISGFNFHFQTQEMLIMQLVENKNETFFVTDKNISL